MKKIKLKNDMSIPGYGKLAQGTSFMVDSYNKRFVYVQVAPRVTLRLARKRDCEVIY